MYSDPNKHPNKVYTDEEIISKVGASRLNEVLSKKPEREIEIIAEREGYLREIRLLKHRLKLHDGGVFNSKKGLVVGIVISVGIGAGSHFWTPEFPTKVLFPLLCISTLFNLFSFEKLGRAVEWYDDNIRQKIPCEACGVGSVEAQSLHESLHHCLHTLSISPAKEGEKGAEWVLVSELAEEMGEDPQLVGKFLAKEAFEKKRKKSGQYVLIRRMEPLKDVLDTKKEGV